MANTYLRGVLGFKGERGYSAYEIAVKNGFKGTEEQWLATLGTSNTFIKDKKVYTTTSIGETVFNLPNSYIDENHSWVDVCVNGLMIDSDNYTVNTTDKTVTLTNALEKTGSIVEIICFSIATNSLPMIVYSGQVLEINPGTEVVEKDYPSGVTNTSKVMSVMSSPDNINWVNCVNDEPSVDGDAYVTNIKLKENKIDITIKNTNTSELRNCYYKIVFLNLD